jgi:hypothetical protein
LENAFWSWMTSSRLSSAAPALASRSRAPQVDQFLGRFRRLLPCQALAHHQRQSVFQRCVFALLERAGDLSANCRFCNMASRLSRHALHGACAEASTRACSTAS